MLRSNAMIVGETPLQIETIEELNATHSHSADTSATVVETLEVAKTPTATSERKDSIVTQTNSTVSRQERERTWTVKLQVR